MPSRGFHENGLGLVWATFTLARSVPLAGGTWAARISATVTVATCNWSERERPIVHRLL